MMRQVERAAALALQQLLHGERIVGAATIAATFAQLSFR
jgi:hypothetical protein